MAAPFMHAAEHGQRSRLKQALKELAHIKPQDLARNDLRSRNLSFHTGLPYFERTLKLFRSLAGGNLSKVPSTYLSIVADHAERTLTQLGEISRFTGEGLPNAHEVRNHLIAEVRDCYRELHDDIALLIPHPPGQQEHPSRGPWYAGAMLGVTLFAIFAAGLAAAYHYGLIGFAVQDVMDSIRQVAHL
jgi:hypothetical protein